MKKIIFFLILFTSVSFAFKALTTQQQKLSYTFGSQIGNMLKQQKVDLDIKVLAKGIEDALKGKKLLLSEDQMMKTLNVLKNKQQAKRKKSAVVNLKKGEQFLAKNREKKGIISLKNGIQYKILKKGDKKTYPKKTDKVTVNYEGSLIDGTIFDSSYKRKQPASFPLNRVIKGWTETIPLMSKGAIWKIYIPASLAYGKSGQGPRIGPNQTLIFKIELLSIN